jgi:antitoxin (DNA-binding transcriptional repressor) of toxin-antitoxin stability system
MPKIEARAARENFNQLLDRIDGGENFVILRGGHAIARLVPAFAPVACPKRPDRSRIRFGTARSEEDRFTRADDRT